MADARRLHRHPRRADHRRWPDRGAVITQHALVAMVAGTRAPTTFEGSCMYCGARCYGKTCAGHRDLLAIERQTWRGTERRAA